jgi:predicted PurR-regulated permease PerM
MDNHFRNSALLLLTALILAIIFLKPIVIMCLTALLLSYISYPFYKRLNCIIKRKSISAFIIISLIMIVLIVPSFLIVNSLSREVFSSYLRMKQTLSAEGQCSTLTCTIINILPLSQIDTTVRSLLESSVGRITSSTFTTLSNVIVGLPNTLFNFFVILFLTYYLLKDGDHFIEQLKKSLPIKRANLEEIIARLDQVARAVVFGYIVIAVIQGALAAAGFYFAGISSPILWGIVTIVTALIPFLGAFAVWFPLSVIQFFNGYIANDQAMMLKAIILSAYGLLVVSSIDNVLKPKIIGENAKIHPAIILLGVVGGIYVLGAIGVVIGPLFLALAETSISIYNKERKATQTS